MTTVVVSRLAASDEASILRELATTAGLRIAAKYDRLFSRLFGLLSEHPGIGAPRPALGSGTRVGIVLPYLIFYRHNKETDTVTILRILHGRRNITRTLLQHRN